MTRCMSLFFFVVYCNRCSQASDCGYSSWTVSVQDVRAAIAISDASCFVTMDLTDRAEGRNEIKIQFISPSRIES